MNNLKKFLLIPNTTKSISDSKIDSILDLLLSYECSIYALTDSSLERFSDKLTLIDSIALESDINN